jgi:hypothetical protein
MMFGTRRKTAEESTCEQQNTGEPLDSVSFLHPGFSPNNPYSRDPYTSAALAATPPSTLRNRRGDSSQGLTPLLLNTASAARGRRRDGGVSSNNNNNNGDKNFLNIVNPNPRPRNRPHRAASELVLNVAVMEEVHGVDVSWLHHTNKGIEMAYLWPETPGKAGQC